MFHQKSQSHIVSAIIIAVVAIGALATVLPWAYTMIQKKEDTKSIEDIYSFFKDMDETIRNIAKNGGEESLTLKVSGRFTVYPELASHPLNNSIVFLFSSKVSNVAECTEEIEECWIPLNTPNPNATATLGKDTPSVIFGKATRSGSAIDIEHKLWYRELYDSSSGRSYRIVLNTTDSTIKSTNTGFLRIQRIGSVTAGNLIITEINIIV